MTIPEPLRQLIPSITVDHVVGTIGVFVLAVWLLRTSLGRKSLIGAPQRRHCMAPYIPFIPLFAWFFGAAVVQSIVVTLHPVEGYAKMLQDQGIYCVIAVLTVVGLILPLARSHFARGLRGFGLRFRTLPRDVVAAFVHLLAVWPVVLGAIVVTTVVGKLIAHWMGSPDFEMPQHEALRELTKQPGVSLEILLIILAVVVAPVTEEMIFRGLFQTMIRSYLNRPWPAIVVTSVMFAMVHADLAHWPALFVLSMGLGYSYEKSGSLFRPIFMHAFFNAVAILASLLE